MALTWADFAKHVDAVAADEGRWIGLLDEAGSYLMDAPPLVSLNAPQTRNVPTSLVATFTVGSPTGVVHPLVEELGAKNLGRVDLYGKLVPVTGPARFVAIQEPGTYRRVYRVTHTVISGGPSGPATMEVHGVDMLGEINRYVAWSAPITITGRFTRFTRDWAGPENVKTTFAQPRDLQDVKFVTVADGVTTVGPAEQVIREIMTKSLQACWRATGNATIIANPPMVVDPTPTGRPSRTLYLRPEDGPLLDTVSSLALSAGVVISARMWLPCDKTIPRLNLTMPTVVVSVQQT